MTTEKNEQATAPSQQQIVNGLNRPLLPALIDKRDGREYLPIYVAISQANRIFGHGGWYPEIRQHAAVSDNQGYVIGYKCIARIHVPELGIYCEGIGFEAMTKRREDPKPLQTAQAHDTAMKGAESDAVKRALRYLGDQFGNSLYEKTHHRRRMFEYAERLVAQIEGSGRAAATKILGPFRSKDDVPLSTSLRHYFNASETILEKQDEKEDADDTTTEIEESYPEIDEEDQEYQDSDNEENHDDMPARRQRRDAFRNGRDSDDNDRNRNGDEHDREYQEDRRERSRSERD